MHLRAELMAGGHHPGATGDAGDRPAHLFLMDLLAREAPDDAVLSEEGRDDLRRLDHERVWIVDPVDGTREFSEPGRTDWAVHVALAIDGVAVVGAVALPGPWASPSAPTRRHRRARRTMTRSASSCRGADRRTRRGWSRRRWAAGSCRWARPARRPWPSCSARPTSTPTPAASTSGTTPPPPRSRPPPVCTSAGSTGARCATTRPTRGCPTCSSAVPTSPMPVLQALRALTISARRR